jgi:hypothetical protein
VFDMNSMPRTSMAFIRALCAQSAAAGRVEDIALEDAETLLGLDYINGSNVPYGPPPLPQEDKL